MTKTMLVVGASGIVGRAVMELATTEPGWRVIGLSRRPPHLLDDLEHRAVDLMDPAGVADALKGLSSLTHLVYAALFEKPGLVPGWRERDQMDMNLAMLRHVMEPLARLAPHLEHVTLLQGTKAYGAHLHPIAVPAREASPRDAHENFYWLQQDKLVQLAKQQGFAFTILRPQIIFGHARHAPMNLLAALGAYGALLKAKGEPLHFPGGPGNVLEAVDARLLAQVILWAGRAKSARNEIFNVTNGDVFTFPNVWPALARALGMDMGELRPRLLAETMPAESAAWEALVSRHGLTSGPLMDFVGDSFTYADFAMAARQKAAGPPVIVSTIKLRQAGFAGCIDTETMFADWFAKLQALRVLPPA